MSDGISQGYEAEDEFKDAAYKRFGNLTPSELADKLRAAHDGTLLLESEVQRLEAELRDMRETRDMLLTIQFDRVQGKQRKA
jgi:hypothetical protein